MKELLCFGKDEELKRDGILYLSIKVIPNAPKTELVEKILGPENEEIWKIKVAGPPTKGKANAELCRHLSTIFKVPKKCVTIISGHTSPWKLLKISGSADDAGGYGRHD